MRTPFTAALLLCLAASGCRRDRPYPVERAEVASGNLSRAGLQISRSDLQGELTRRLGAAGFALVEGEEAPRDAVRLTLEVMARPDTGQVGAVLHLRRRTETGQVSYEVGEASDPPSSARSEATARAALGQALDRALRQGRLQLQAADKPDGELVKDLASGDKAVRESAVRVLTDRRNPAVVQALLDQLGGDEPDEVRRAIGALVEMKEKRAVAPLIELGDARDPTFLREVIYALGGIGGEEAQAYLYTVAQGHDQPAIREAAQQALDELSRSEQKPDRGLSSREGEAPRQ
ncbi:MAG TPA: HEAT repeat domain-containing protein [Myxococcales bacterium]|nr:HEAT repeat domain-containing protein [Myxococcales bacterium]